MTVRTDTGAFAGRIGVARADITPPAGIYARNWGAATWHQARGVHRPLTATCLAFSDGGEPLVLIALDLGWWRNRDDEGALRGAVREALGLGVERVVVALSHTHSGPAIDSGSAAMPGGMLIPPYLARLRATCVELARAAIADARPAVLEWRYGHCALAADRDLPDPPRGRFVSGWNPEVAADDTVLVGRVADADGAVRATIVNYACHPTTLGWDNDLISPDYPGAMREVVEGGTGGAPCLFLQGASGELAPAEQYSGDPALADRHGRQLGHAVLSALAGLGEPATGIASAGVVESGAPLAVWRRAAAAPSTALAARALEVDLPLKHDLPDCAEIERRLATERDNALRERLRRKRGVRAAVGDGRSVHEHAWLWKIGGAVLAAHPFEAYSRLQRELRAFAGGPVAVVNHGNGGYGYLPPADHYARDQYTVWQTPYAAGGLELLAARYREAMQAPLEAHARQGKAG